MSYHQNTKQSPGVPPELYAKVMARLVAEREMAKKRAFFASALFFIGLFSLGAVLLSAFAAESVRTGFSDYTSLIVSDFNTVIAVGPDFIFSLLETLPVMSAVEVLATLLVGLISIRFVVL